MFRQTRLDWFASRSVVRSDRRRNPRSSRSPQRRALRFEPLEDRRLLAITVDTLIDQNDGIGVGGTSLREAIAAATPGEEINFNVTGTIALTHGELLINKSLTITGPAANLLTIDAGGDSRVFHVNNFNASLVNVSISGLTITGGVVGDDGGGILNRETLTVTACEITGNSAEDGGGIANFQGTFSLFDSTVSHNSASGALGGGAGIFSFSTNLSDVSTIRNSTLSTNDASTTAGGGVYNFHGTLLVQHSTITDNTAHGNLGSGIATLGDVSEAVTIVRSSIVAGNTFSDVDVVVGFETAISSEGFNLVGFGNVTGSFTNGGDQRFATDAIIKLAPLGNYGGPTSTHFLLPGSPAIDSGNLSEINPPEHDQRGAGFDRVLDGDGNDSSRIDKGAVEVAGGYLIVDLLEDELDGDFTVGDLSLREAIALANMSRSTMIVFDPALFEDGPAEIALGGQLVIMRSVDIEGPGANLLTINAQGNSRVFLIDDGLVDGYLVAGIERVTITGGNAPGQAGGAILNREYLDVRDAVITGNQAKWGGGIYNDKTGEMTLASSTLSNNSAVSPGPSDFGSGGGLYNHGGIAYVSNSTITGNHAPDGAGLKNVNEGEMALNLSTVSGNIAERKGGGIASYGGLLEMHGSTISGNSAGVGGGGVFTSGAATDVRSSLVSENSAPQGGGIWAFDDSVLTVDRSTISGNSAVDDDEESFNSGGGVRVDGSAAGFFDSVLYGNSATFGGALYVDGSINDITRVKNTTISSNFAPSAGGGVYNYHGLVIFEYSTVTNNNSNFSGSGITSWEDTANTLTEIYSTIVAGNHQTDLAIDGFFNTFQSNGFNLIGVPGPDVTFEQDGDQVIGTDDPRLGPLADNGGPTKTHRLLAGSLALDAGNPDAVAGVDGVPDFDQRGPGFDRIRNGEPSESVVIDIGAFEAQQIVVGPDLPGDYNRDLTVDAADYTVWRDTLGTEVDRYDGADGDGDYEIGEGDYGVWKDHFGESLPEEGRGLGTVSETLAMAGSASLDGTILVTTLADAVDLADGLTSLREAIFAANIVSGLNTIEFDPALTAGGPATLLLTHGELAIIDAVTINGPGADLLTIDASGNDVDPNVFGDGSRIFNVDDGIASGVIDVEIRDFTLTGGDASQFGGAILSRERLLAERLTIVDNWATLGGAIALFPTGGTSTIANCNITSNTAASQGGAFFVQGAAAGTAVIRDSNIAQNQANRGGALYAGPGSADAILIISGNTIVENTALQQGGAIYLTSTTSPKTTIRSSLLSGNSSMDQGGAIFVNGVRDLAIIDSRLVENKTLRPSASQGRGGAIYATASDIAITGSTISGNSALSGGGINSRNGELTISFSTIADNKATAGDGGGIYSNLDRLSIIGSTISGNIATGTSSQIGRGGGLWHAVGPSPATLQDTLVTGNSATNAGGGAFFRSVSYTSGTSVLLSNASFSGNSAVRGGGIAFGDNTAFAGSAMFNGGSIANNTATTNGGGIYGTAYSLLFQGTTITGNHANGNGGGVATSQASGRAFLSMSFVGATIANNSAGTGASPGALGFGGGLYIPSSGIALTLFQTSVSQNSARVGGGIARTPQSSSIPTVIVDSAISGNTSTLHGAGIYQSGSSLSLTRSTIANNVASPASSEILANGGGIFARTADVSLLESSLIGNSTNSGRGGGLFLDQAGDLTVTGSTIAGNSARQDGGGVWDGANNDRVLIQSSTISGNSAQGTGGLYLRGNISIRHSTITKNIGSGTRPGGLLAGDGARQLELDHTIVAGNSHLSGGPPDLRWFLSPSTVTIRSSLIGDNTSTTLVEAPVGSPDVNGNLVGKPLSTGGHGVIAPVLGPLANNGGRTLTHALLPGSPALDGGALITLPPLGYDQRGNPFSRMVDGTGDGIIRIDIGAYESQGVPSFSPGDFNRDGIVDACDYTIWRGTLGFFVVAPFDGADGDGDGTVDADDYGVWKSHFGQKFVFSTGGGSAALSLLAEPAAEVASVVAPSLAEPPRIVPATNRVARYSTQLAVAPDDSDALVAWLPRQSRSADPNDEAFAADQDAADADVTDSDAFGESLDAAFAVFGT